MKPSPETPLLPRFYRYLPLRTGHPALDFCLLLVPAAFLVRYMTGSAVLIFIAVALGIIPLAASLGKATEDLSSKLGEMLGGLLNATMGNATELIIAFFALREGHQAVVKASLSGSIIGNVLLVLGTSVWVGGIGRQKQTFDRRTVSASVTMLFIAVIALVVPAVYALSVHGRLTTKTQALDRFSLCTGAVLIALYGCGLLFQIRNREAPRESEPADASNGPSWLPVLSLILATALIAILSDILVNEIGAAQHALGLSSMFVGVVIVATVGNAAEHSTAILVAHKNKMDLSLSICIGSSVQIALFVAPVLVFASYLLGNPMQLVFSPLEIAGIALAILTLEMIVNDGETVWFEGAELIAAYLILGIAFYLVPE
ncbi:MAG TPA: calcium/proton exchanger [Terriglobales bacterium]|nr:calcium/proton exchanger [Terriglobales bacterium]